MTVIPVTVGTFECPYCDALWVGSWQGDPALMTCPKCERSLRCNVEKDNGRVISNRDEDYCTFIVQHDGPHSWEKNGVPT